MKKIFCQSCGMPLDQPDTHGTEYDGSPSTEYCKYCYKEGSFTFPALTLADMQSHVSAKLSEEEMPSDIIETAVSRVPSLKRWRLSHSDVDKKTS